MNSLFDSIQYFKGIGPQKAKLFKKIGIYSVEDLLYYFPRRYEDRRNLAKISQLKIGNIYTIKAKVLAKSDRRSWKRRSFSIVEIAVGDETGRIFAVWFNQPYLKDYFKVGQYLILYGKVELYKKRIQVSNPEFEILSDDKNDFLSTGRIVPVYSLSSGLSQRFMRKIVKSALDRYLYQIVDPLPYNIRNKHNLLNLAQSLLSIHFPESQEINEAAYRRLSFQEFFLFQLPIVLRKIHRHREKGIKHIGEGVIFRQMKDNLPFQLTSAQERELENIKKDMCSEFPMQRLLQGEVGCGKTIVAVLAAAIALDGGYQVAFMVPTEILAKQHFENIRTQISKIENANIEMVLLTSDIKSKTKHEIYTKISQRDIHLIIGTHALIQQDLVFKNLGLVVIDEQQRFGVAQRACLAKKGINPDVLIMTATPIPRTLSLTIYGDLDISVIDELPQGRPQLKTLSYSEDSLGQVYEFVGNLLKGGGQAYFVCPVIKESEQQDIKAAEGLFKELKNKVFKEFRIGLLHGQIQTEVSHKTMEEFKAGKIDVLVATSVLEVGIDIPNATCMVVLQAERFGLSQLHQLRGRIGRGKKESFFIVVSQPKSEAAKRRIKSIEELKDGFRIAEEDLKIRGPGEFFGKRQHGLSNLSIANPLTQFRLLRKARQEVYLLLKEDPFLVKRQNKELFRIMKNKFPNFPHLEIIA